MNFPLSAIIMFIFGSLVLYGGLLYFIYIAFKKQKKDEKDLNELNR
jgi:hypothetical protein